MPEEIEVTLFRVLQESLTNMHRHSKSSSAEIGLAIYRGEVSLQVTDHGQGILPRYWSASKSRPRNGGVGLSGIRERVTDLGGRLEIHSDGQGTVVSIAIPVASTQARS